MMISFKKIKAFSNIIVINLKKIKGFLYVVGFIPVMICFLFIGGCANLGVGPTGGPRDSIPPVVVRSIPAPSQIMFSGKDIEVSFDEYVMPDSLSEKLAISPPLSKKPSIVTKGKSVVIKIDEDLIPDRTYSVDFQNGIKDYNEGNKINRLRINFSTGNNLDTLMIGGYMINAFTLEPVRNELATLYTVENDSVFHNIKPYFIARTNKDGYFLFDNLPSGQYKLYGLKDNDKNLFHSQATELIAFADSMISPSIINKARPDTIFNGNDTIVSTGQNVYSPDNITLLLFEEKVNSQFIASIKRDPQDKCLIVFNEPLTDSLNVEPLDSLISVSCFKMEFNDNKDSIFVFITDSILLKADTISFSIKYTSTDSLGNFVTSTDSLKFNYKKPETPKKNKNNDNPSDDIYFKFSTNIVTSNFDLDKTIILEAPSPIERLDNEMIGLNELINDSTLKPIKFELKQIESANRKFQIIFPMVENTKYQLSIDTAEVKTLTGLPNAGFKTKFSTQEADYYGSIILSLTGIDGKGKVLLLKNSIKEELVKEVFVEGTQKTVEFNFLKPDKYILKFFRDLNSNGKWDTGNLLKKLQPEPVMYFQKVVNVKSNWEIKEDWELNSSQVQAKKFDDEAKEEYKSGR